MAGRGAVGKSDSASHSLLQRRQPPGRNMVASSHRNNPSAESAGARERRGPAEASPAPDRTDRCPSLVVRAPPYACRTPAPVRQAATQASKGRRYRRRRRMTVARAVERSAWRGVSVCGCALGAPGGLQRSQPERGRVTAARNLTHLFLLKSRPCDFWRPFESLRACSTRDKADDPLAARLPRSSSLFASQHPHDGRHIAVDTQRPARSLRRGLDARANRGRDCRDRVSHRGASAAHACPLATRGSAAPPSSRLTMTGGALTLHRSSGPGRCIASCWSTGSRASRRRWRAGHRRRQGRQRRGRRPSGRRRARKRRQRARRSLRRHPRNNAREWGFE